jgi:hypothetical protein
MCACVHVRACAIVEAVCRITDDGMWLASLWGYVWNKCDTEVLNVVPVKGRFFVVVVNEDLKSTVLHVAVGFVLISMWVRQERSYAAVAGICCILAIYDTLQHTACTLA